MEETDPGSGVDPIEALRGWAEGLNLGEKLLESRREDVELEELADELGMLKLPYKRIDVEKLG